tara:strand:+ start:360 stop:1391 length:1032 start_codon:yes stop_codon:yes gene_type:complete
MRCLFLGYDSSKTKLINFLKKKKILVTHQKKAIKKGIEKFDLIISFGYRQIIKSDILKKVKRPILNLHMSYLPFNKGSYPNFWSFHDDTKKGITIHEIDKNLDTGPIIFQKEIKLNIKKNKKITFRKFYDILFLELEELFIKNYKSIISNNYRKKKNNKFKGRTHLIKDLPKDLKNWDISIFNYFNSLITYKKISSKSHAHIIWKINNEKDSRKYSRNPEFFSYKNHLKWLEELLKNNKESLFMAKKDKKVIGIIQERKEGDKLFLSWALLKKFRGKNYGTGLIKEFLKKRRKKFFAEIHKHNIRSIKICKKAGFKFLRTVNNFYLFYYEKNTRKQLDKILVN